MEGLHFVLTSNDVQVDTVHNHLVSSLCGSLGCIRAGQLIEDLDSAQKTHGGKERMADHPCSGYAISVGPMAQGESWERKFVGTM